MRIIISPTKRMEVDTDSLPWQALPTFLSRSERLLEALRAMDAPSLKQLWQCNEQILLLNLERLEGMDLRRNLTPAILSYKGIQYRYMAPGVFTDLEYAYVQNRLRILSGFYGLLRPFDGVTPYRLEMQARLEVGQAKDLYSFWGNIIAQQLFKETDCILNLASREYSLCVSQYLTPSTRFLTCVFGEDRKGRVVEKGTLCKMARGEMVRWLAENQVSDPEAVKGFNHLGYQYAPRYSSRDVFVFLRENSTS